MKTELFYIIIATIFYYLTFIFIANKFALNKWFKNSKEDSEAINYNIIALNLNIIILLFVSYDNLLNHFTFITSGINKFSSILATGTVIILFNFIIIFLSYFGAILFKKMVTNEKIIYLIPIIWVTLTLLLTKLSNLYYETIISTQGFNIM